jgi:hypothetical protein
VKSEKMGFLCEDFKILNIKAIVIFKAKMKSKTWKMEIIIKLFLKIKTEKNFFFSSLYESRKDRKPGMISSVTWTMLKSACERRGHSTGRRFAMGLDGKREEHDQAGGLVRKM